MFNLLPLVWLTFILLEVESAPNFKREVESDLRFERQSSDCHDWKPIECQKLGQGACGTFTVQIDCPRTCQKCDYLA
ncbi:hypothetical protein ACROYT_G012777 [Oculina patagonica]